MQRCNSQVVQYLTAVLFLFCFALTTHAQAPSNAPNGAPTLSLVADQSSDDDLARYFSYWLETDPTSAQEVAKALHAFTPVKKKVINFGFSPQPHWLRIRVKNTSATAGTWALYTSTRMRKSFQVYQWDGEQIKTLANIQDGASFYDRPVRYNLLAAKITLPANAEQELLIRSESLFTSRLRVQFMSEQEFNAIQQRDNAILFSFVAAMAMLIMVNMVFFITVRKSVYLYCAAMTLVSALYVTQHDGYNFQYLWPYWPTWDNDFTLAIGVMMAMCTLLLYRKAIDLKSLAPRFDLCLKVLMLGWGLLLPSLFLFNPTEFSRNAASGAVSLSAMILAVMMFISLRARVTSALLFSIGWFCFFLTNTIFLLVCLGLDALPNFHGTHTLKLGLLAEAFFVSTALAYQIRLSNLRFRLTQEEHEALIKRHLKDHEDFKKVSKEKEQIELKGREIAMQIASTSHDVQQPLCALRLGLQALKDKSDSLQRYKGNVHEINGVDWQNYAQTLTNMEDALLVAEKVLKQSLSQSKQQWKGGRVELNKLFAQVFALNFMDAHEKDLIFKYAPTRLKLDANEHVVMRILNNLVSNAIRYTPKGKILLGARRRKEGIELQVLDTGCGMTEKETIDVLQPFTRAGDTSAVDGHGLGLSIVKDLCQQYGYTLRVASVNQQGSLFAIYIPYTNGIKATTPSRLAR